MNKPLTLAVLGTAFVSWAAFSSNHYSRPDCSGDWRACGYGPGCSPDRRACGDRAAARFGGRQSSYV